MRKLRNAFFWFFCIVCISAPVPSIASEKFETFETAHFSVGIGWESLKYSEHEPDMNLESEAKVSNWTLGLDGFKQWTYIFCGFKGIIPVHRISDSEEWRVSDILTQQNTLKYGWTRIDAFFGCRLTSFFSPFVGIRWSESEQERTAFAVLGTPVAGSATEKVTSWFIGLGIKGDILLIPRLRLYYSGAYFEPISSEVDNSNLPGWEVTDTDGYMFEFEGQAEYKCNDTISIVFSLYGGKMHWNGSGWIPHAGRSIKWPENDTRYLGCMVNARWSF